MGIPINRNLPTETHTIWHYLQSDLFSDAGMLSANQRSTHQLFAEASASIPLSEAKSSQRQRVAERRRTANRRRGLSGAAAIDQDTRSMIIMLLSLTYKVFVSSPPADRGEDEVRLVFTPAPRGQTPGENRKVKKTCCAAYVSCCCLLGPQRGPADASCSSPTSTSVIVPVAI